MVCFGVLVLCDGSCCDLCYDFNYCGVCDQLCEVGVCVEGVCVVSCLVHQLFCGVFCVDLKIDENNCGAIDNCEGVNVGAVCFEGELCDGIGICVLIC